MTNAFIAFTDGSASTKDRSGGWAWIVIDEEGDEVGSASDWESDTTISRMELTAPARALDWIRENYGPSEVMVYSDSEYVVKGINENRKRNLNKDKWDDLDGVRLAHIGVYWEHVKGHSDDIFNDKVDKLAGEARRRGIYDCPGT